MHIASGSFPSITSFFSNFKSFIISLEVVSTAQENKNPHRGHHDLVKLKNLALSKIGVFILL